MTQLLHQLQQVLGERYILEREVGHGGMAFVFLAQDRRYERPVAIKVLDPDIGAQIELGFAISGARVMELMKLREGDEVSAVALVVESDAPTEGNGDGATPVLEAGGETVALEPAAEANGDGVVSVDPPADEDAPPEE